MSVQSLPSSLKETRTQGTVTFPCTVYRADASASEIPRPFITKVHWHDAVEILHFIHGHFRVRVGMEEYDICQEAFCFVGSGKLHAIYSADGYLEEALLFSPYILESPGVDSAERDLIDPLRSGQLTLPLMIDESSPAFCQIRHEYQVCQAIFESRSRIQGDQHMLEDAASQLRVKAALMNILATLSETGLLGEPSGKEDPRLETLKKVLGYIRDHFSEKIYLSDLAQLMNMNQYNDQMSIELAGAITPVLNKGDKIHFDWREAGASTNGLCISTALEEDRVPLLLKMWDYTMSEEGQLFANWGVEGVTFEYDENGNPRFTELVTNSPLPAFSIALNIYTLGGGAVSVIDKSREFGNYAENQMEAMEIWNANVDGAYDLPDLMTLNTQESADLAQVLREAVKYNRTNIADAYGLSVYFPYQRISNVDKAVSTYAAIGMDDSYSKAIRAFASVEASGQAVSGSSGSALSSLFGGGSSSSSGSGDLIGSLLSSFLGGGMDGMDFLSGRTLTEEQLGQYLTVNMLDPDKLVFQRYSDQWVIDLPAEQWALVHGIDMNMFYRTDAGYIDMGLDNLFELDPETGLMIADTSGTWLAINGQPVPYYHELSESVSENEWRITGRVPALLNGDRVDLLLVFDQDHESGYVAGARAVYDDPAIEAIPKNLTEIAEGDTITFLADLYDENQNHVDNYAFGNPITVAGELTVSDVEMPDPTKAVITYRFTDIYNVAYWTQAIGK